jgi:hypothetical protein
MGEGAWVAGAEAGVESSVVAVLVKEVERVVGGWGAEEAGLGVGGLAAAVAAAAAAAVEVLAAAAAVVEVLAAAAAAVEVLAATAAWAEVLAAGLVVVVETAQ